jgi:nicotinate-nucleotide adenylyltransferase
MPAPDKGERWGILGGAFDPVHRGHITLSRDIGRSKRLDGVLLIPSSNHPFKDGQCVASFQHRLEMLKLAARQFDLFLVSDIERQQNLSGYTIDTIRAVKAAYPDTEFYFIIGADNIDQMRQWYQPEEIFREVGVIAGTRPGYVPHHADGSLAAEIEFIETEAVDISSTEVRKAICCGGGVSAVADRLAPDVRDYIIKHGLYQ